MSETWMIGVDLGGTKAEVILLDQHSQVHYRSRLPTPYGDYQGTLAVIGRLVQAAEERAGASGLSVGVGIPGSVSGLTGRVKNGNSTWLNGRQLGEDLQVVLGRPVTLTNDANCLALSEATDGAGKGFGVVWAVILGTGCGSGISVGGRLLAGPNGVAGEWGHNPLPWTAQAELDRRPCFLWSFRVQRDILVRLWVVLVPSPALGESMDVRAIVAAAGQGQVFAARTLERYIGQLARGMASVINVVDPDIVVLGGGLSNVAEIYQALPERLAEWVFGGECSTPIEPAKYGDSSGVRGAAWLGGLAAGEKPG